MLSNHRIHPLDVTQCHAVGFIKMLKDEWPYWLLDFSHPRQRLDSNRGILGIENCHVTVAFASLASVYRQQCTQVDKESTVYL